MPPIGSFVIAVLLVAVFFGLPTDQLTNAGGKPPVKMKTTGGPVNQAMHVLTPAIILGGSTSVLAVAAVAMRSSHVPTRPAAAVCPHCRQSLGGDNLRDAAIITHRWKLVRGQTVAKAQLPGLTFLIACPHCATEFEITTDGKHFLAPRTGVLRHIRTGRLSTMPMTMVKAAA